MIDRMGELPKLEIGQGRRNVITPQTPPTPPKKKTPAPAAEPSTTEPKTPKLEAVRRKKIKRNAFVNNKGILVAQQTTRSYRLEWDVAEGLSDYAHSTKQSASMIVNELIKKHVLKQQ